MKKNSIQIGETAQERHDRIWARLDRMAEQLGGVGDSQGDDAEEFFYYTLRADKTVGGICFDDIHAKVKGGPPGRQQEYDLILENGRHVAVIEVKYKFKKSDLHQLDLQLARIRSDFPVYKRKRLYGGIAGFSIPTEVAAAARARGYFVLRRRGQLLRVEATDMKEAPV
jgi:hypothetical protein